MNARITMKIESVENEWRIKSAVIVVLRFAFYDPSECVCIRLYMHTHTVHMHNGQTMRRHTHWLASVGDAFFVVVVIAEHTNERSDVVWNIFAVSLHAKGRSSRK